MSDEQSFQSDYRQARRLQPQVVGGSHHQYHQSRHEPVGSSSSMWQTAQPHIQDLVRSLPTAIDRPASISLPGKNTGPPQNPSTVSPRSFGQGITMKMYREDRMHIHRVPRSLDSETKCKLERSCLLPRPNHRDLSKLRVRQNTEHNPSSPNADSRVHKVKIHVQSTTHPEPSEESFSCYLNLDPTTHKILIRPPSRPKIMQQTMRRMAPTINYVQYACTEHCRSRGICVHMSFVLGCRSTPDGLICPVCRESGVSEPITTDRICPRHNQGYRTGFVANLLEDVLATEEQRHRAEEYWLRAWNGDWSGIEMETGSSSSGAVSEEGSSRPAKRRRASASLGHELGAADKEDEAAEADDAIPAAQ